MKSLVKESQVASHNWFQICQNYFSFSLCCWQADTSPNSHPHFEEVSPKCKVSPKWLQLIAKKIHITTFPQLHMNVSKQTRDMEVSILPTQRLLLEGTREVGARKWWIRFEDATRVNKRLKQWGILAQIYSHNKVNHIDVVWAVAIITHIAFNQGEGLFPCKDYKDEF